ELGHYYKPVAQRECILFFYRGRDGAARETSIHLSPAPDEVNGTTARWKLKLPPFKRFHIQTTITPLVEDKRSRAGRIDFGDSLRVLARHQGKEQNDWRDEEPGKILHEYREGEMTRSGEMPFGPYYGSVDATPLWLVLLSETFNWTSDEQLVKDMLPHAYRA